MPRWNCTELPHAPYRVPVRKQLLSQLCMFHRGAEQLPGERADVPAVDSLFRDACCTVPDVSYWAKGTARAGAHYDVRLALQSSAVTLHCRNRVSLCDHPQCQVLQNLTL